ncbi:MAG: protein kinase domain-containing protein [Planctomycetota bacterium]
MGRTFSLAPGQTVKIGRAEDADVVLKDPSVSRHHAEFYFEGQDPWVRDLGSSHGLFLRNEKIVQTLLKNGDWLVLGDTVITVQIPEEVLLPTIEGFRVLERIGSGGMGTVYRAEDGHTGREVALKVLAFASESEREKVALFAREARTIGKLRHPNVVEIYDIGFAKGYHYIEMEFVRGTSVQARLQKEGAFPVPETIAIAIQVAEVLDAAEKKGIVHRDIKPGNLILAEENRVKVCDFGLAKELDRAGLGWQTAGTSRGTVDTMAPEQYNAPEIVGPKSDQYALGATLFHMLTGRPRLSGGPMTTYLLRVTQEDPPPLSHSVKGIPPALDATVARMLQRDPADRFDRASDVLKAFTDIATRLEQETDG